jgi:hypothetical protein
MLTIRDVQLGAFADVSRSTLVDRLVEHLLDTLQPHTAALEPRSLYSWTRALADQFAVWEITSVSDLTFVMELLLVAGDGVVMGRNAGPVRAVLANRELATQARLDYLLMAVAAGGR